MAELLTDEAIERALTRLMTRMHTDVDLESLLESLDERIRLEPPPARDRADGSLGRRLAIAALALTVATAGTLVAVGAFRHTAPKKPAEVRPAEFNALWPEHSRADAARVQALVDAGASPRWRLTAQATARKFTSSVLGWDTPVGFASACGLDGCPDVSPQDSVQPVGAAIEIAPGKATVGTVDVHLARLVRPGQGGIWSVVSVNSGDGGLGSLEVPLSSETGPAANLIRGPFTRAGAEVQVRSDLPRTAHVGAALGLWTPCGFETYSVRPHKDGAFWKFSLPDRAAPRCQIDLPFFGTDGIVIVAQGATRYPDTPRLAAEGFGGIVYNFPGFPKEIVRLAAVPISFRFDHGLPTTLPSGRVSFLGPCPDLAGTLPVGPAFDAGARRAAQAYAAKGWAVSGPGASGKKFGFATTECGPDVARRTWIVNIYPLAQPDSASLPIDLYMVRRASGWEIWGSY